ncbi:hypothetical protein E2C01_025171 [Portunus trituberculatus]|uniref:Uncharacterized protein n=1 Tax=Portunus trituberculatus TaxID=210409 RepID=A0A5B7ECN0_PORTR|nr:hypothetical protein [Portunus trituberculatus]
MDISTQNNSQQPNTCKLQEANTLKYGETRRFVKQKQLKCVVTSRRLPRPPSDPGKTQVGYEVTTQIK